MWYGQCSSLDAKVWQRIKNRGPDCMHTVQINDDNVELSFCGAVLWMQGPKPVVQPIENDHGVLLYNGDIFDDKWDRNCNDAEVIMEKISNQGEYSENQIINILKLLKGPFSLIYYDKKSGNLYFTRDRMGRISLLFHKKENSFIISSVLGREYNCIEIPATYIYKINLKTCLITLHSWTNDTIRKQYVLENWLEENDQQQNLPDDQFSFEFDTSIDLSTEDGVVQSIETAMKINDCKISFMKNLMKNFIIQETIHNLRELLEKSVKHIVRLLVGFYY
ncbi:unnamed protein product, partial [Iphiclides podalirius]